jgi:hypothetical protein
LRPRHFVSQRLLGFSMFSFMQGFFNNAQNVSTNHSMFSNVQGDQTVVHNHHYHSQPNSISFNTYTLTLPSTDGPAPKKKSPSQKKLSIPQPKNAQVTKSTSGGGELKMVFTLRYARSPLSIQISVGCDTFCTTTSHIECLLNLTNFLDLIN